MRLCTALSRTQMWALLNTTTKLNLKARYILNSLKTLGFVKNRSIEFPRKNLTFVYVNFTHEWFQD